MAGWSPAIFTIALCLLYGIQHSQSCSVVCPPKEKICTCPDGKPTPTPDPSGFVAIDSCGGLIHYCSVGGECKPEENGCPADCPQLCTMDYSPVCGTDGKTYSNKCGLEVAACKTRNSDLAVASQGECAVCPLCATIYSPVCGSDGNTYSSKCALDSKACREKIELTVSYSGKCDKKCSPFCTFEYDPICGTDGQTYSNKCSLEAKACTERSNLAEAHSGECEAPNAPGRAPILGPGALPPAWTQVENSDTCLKKYKPSTPQDALHFEVCVPLFKPDECSQPTWWELATALEVVPREELVSAKPPQYLQIEGVRDCLDSYQFEGTSHKEACLPAMRPKNLCNPDSWDQLLQVWDGLKCPKAEVQPLGVNRVAPKYQQIGGWERCVFTQQSGQAKTFCIRNYRPLICSLATWNKIKASNLPSCASTPRIIAAPNAVAPAYLSIEGHEKCLSSHSNSQYKVKCLPKSKPSNCSDEIWERVKDSFTGIPCPDTIKALGLGGLPPAYLRVDGHQACLENFEASSTHKELCLPASRPSGCKQDSWKQLKNDGVFKGIQCPLTGLPPMYLSIEGYKKCLSVFQATSNSQGLCMPDSKPRRCREKAWEQLQDYYHGVRCPITTNIGGVGAPQYLSVDGHSECLDEENDGGFKTVCLPETKPTDCQDEAYNKLSQVTDGLPTCKEQVKILNAVPPAYLSINGHKDCLGSSTSNDGGHQEVCLPREQPVNCSRVAWISLQNKFEGKDCEPVVRLLGALPPKYLSVDGHKDCLSQQNFSPNGHIELCLPTSKPDSCSADSWKALSEGGKFSGRQCRPTQIIGIAAPLYTQVPGYEKCLESEQSLVGKHQELCLPVTKPFSCAQKAWNKLQQVFIGKDCGSDQQTKLGDQSSDRIVFVGGQSGLPPKYLSVDGHSGCLSSHNPSSGSHSEVCLPSAKPSSCTENSWNALKKQVKAGDLSKCKTQMVLGGLGALPPKYLSIDGHQDCLDQHSPRGASHTEICLPVSKPPACSSDSWDKLKLEVEEQRIEKCAPKIILGGIGALPPKYLSVTGHKECLSSHTPFRGATHTSVCLPSGRPSSCLEDSWDQLKVEVQEGRIDKCKPQMVGGQFGLPPSYLGIDGHEKCLSSHSSASSGSHNEVCVPKAKPQPCTVEAWDKLKDEVAQGKLDQCREPSLGLPPPLGSHPSSLPPKYLSVDGWNDCTRGFQASESHTEHCLPLSQPSAPCTSQSYQELMQITFKVDGESTNSRSGDILDAQPPEYLFVADHEKCLDEINVGSHVEKCMPPNRPNGCSSATWVQLQNVFEGQNCKACQKFCVRNYDPVCGSDGVTYSNKCNLEYTGCKESREVTVKKFGKCCPEICTEDYTPVCGSDGVTYSNRCNLESAVCSQGDDSLSFSHEGECKTGSSPTVYSDVGTKQEGESCGSCFSPSSNYDCGKCVSGLECVPDENAHLLPDLPSRCRVPQKVGIKQVGETCGACFDPSNNFDCGNCVEGLYCVADENADILPDLPSRCRVTRVVPRNGGQIGDDCGPCSDSSKNFDCGECDKSKGLECLPPQGPLQDSTPKCQLRLPPPPFLGNSSIVLTPIDCCFRYGFGARATPCCLETITCDEHDKLVEENKVNPILGGGFGKHKICPKDAGEAHHLVSEPTKGAVPTPPPPPQPMPSAPGDSNSSCCFRYGFGARMVPCCMEVITCDEHSEILKQIEENGPMVGGAIGKHQSCPNDAAHAHQLASGEDEVSCYDECLGSGKGPRQCSFECSGDDNLEPPYDKLTYCNKGKDNGEAYCKEQTDDEFNHCWELSYVGRCLINNEEQDNCEGICIPKDIPCDSNDECKDIGSIHSGSVLASCRNNVCEYSRGIAIA